MTADQAPSQAPSAPAPQPTPADLLDVIRAIRADLKSVRRLPSTSTKKASPAR